MKPRFSGWRSLPNIDTLCLLQSDEKPWLPMVLVGGPALIDKLMYQTSRPLASRVVARSHMEHLTRTEMQQDLAHHIGLAGVRHRSL